MHLTISHMLHISHPPHQYMITWDFGSSFKFILLFSFIRLFPSLSLSLNLISFTLCYCVHVTMKSRLSWVESLKSWSLKTCIGKKEKMCRMHLQPCPGWTLRPKPHPTQVRLPFSRTHASQTESKNAMPLVLNLVQCKN